MELRSTSQSQKSVAVLLKAGEGIWSDVYRPSLRPLVRASEKMSDVIDQRAVEFAWWLLFAQESLISKYVHSQNIDVIILIRNLYNEV